MSEAAAGAPRRRGFFGEYGTLLGEGWRTFRAGGAKVVGVAMCTQILLYLLAFPLIRWLFHEALRAGGMVALDLGNLRIGPGIPVTFALIIVICLIAFWLLGLQFALLLTLVQQTAEGGPLTLRSLATTCGAITRKLLRPSSWTLLVYLFFVLPITGFGFASVLVHGITVPAFISGELLKSQPSATILLLFLLFLVVVNIRWSLTLPLFTLTDASGAHALRRSWRLTRGRRSLELPAAVMTVLAGAGASTFLLVIAAVIPTAVADEVAPDAAPTIAAFSLGAAQAVGMLLTALVTALIAGILVAALNRFTAAERSADTPDTARVARTANRAGRRPAILVAALTTVVAVVLGGVGLDTMHRLSTYPETLVLGHRGFTGGGVENTISSLDAALAAGADLVEMDIMQTRDGQYVVMHDANLSRLTGENVNVKDLSLDELTQMTVRDGEGRSDTIPSLSAYVQHAASIGMPLLIEIKLSGAETSDRLDILVEELESLELLDRNIYHSLDAASVTGMKEVRPGVSVGYTMAFAGDGVPDTPADFIVVEEWTATDAIHDAAERSGLGFMVWTVNEESGMRDQLRREVDGIITDHPDRAVAQRDDMRGESGMTGLLTDALMRFVVVL